MSDKDFSTKENLIDKIQYVYETDVGDFKRKATLYLNRFADEQSDKDFQRRIQKLRDRILYKEVSSPVEIKSVDDLRFQLLEALKKL